MQYAIDLAGRATGCTSPNPLVGAVLVRGGVIVGEGWHTVAGTAHAEINAISNANESTRGTTLYVSLEPCSHHGRTPPCTDAIIAAGISTVVYATADTTDAASGGAAVLKAAGIDVITGICEVEAVELNRFFFHHQATGRPYVIAKFASSLDGRTATRTGNSQWITGNAARQRGHDLRQAVDAIIVGSQTVLADNPQLTVRRHPDAQIHCNDAHPLRVVLDSHGRIPASAKIFSKELPGKTLLVTTSELPPEHAEKLLAQDVEVLQLKAEPNSSRPNLAALLSHLGSNDVQSVMVEGGQTLLGSFFDQQLVNEVWAFYAPMLIGGADALPVIGGQGTDQLADATKLEDVQIEHVGDDFLIRSKVAAQHSIAEQSSNSQIETEI